MIKATFNDLVQAQLKKASKFWNKLPAKGQLRLGLVGGMGLGLLATLATLRGIHMRRYHGTMSERRLQEYFTQSGMVQGFHDEKQKSHLMGSAATDDQMRRLFLRGGKV